MPGADVDAATRAGHQAVLVERELEALPIIERSYKEHKIQERGSGVINSQRIRHQVLRARLTSSLDRASSKERVRLNEEVAHHLAVCSHHGEQ